jgi:SRSO17 transposase
LGQPLPYWPIPLQQRKLITAWRPYQPTVQALAVDPEMDLSGLVAGLDRKNGLTLAEQAGDVSPDGMQRLLRWADWDIDAVRDEVRDYVVEHLGDPNGVLIIDDTGFLKKGVKSAGVAQQYSGTAGRIENCQVGVFLAYRSQRGHALSDRQLYLPATWTEDRARCRAAGNPDEVGFTTKTEMARQMLQRVFAAGVPAAWVTMDEGYGHRSRRRDRRVALLTLLLTPSSVLSARQAPAAPGFRSSRPTLPPCSRSPGCPSGRPAARSRIGRAVPDIPGRAVRTTRCCRGADPR